jgi:hypothetical protein
MLAMVLLSTAGCGAFKVRDRSAPIAMCPVHDAPLHEETHRIHYGLVGHDPEMMAEEAKRFPYANESSNGGCMVSSVSPWWCRVSYCEECRKEKEEWVAEGQLQASK